MKIKILRTKLGITIPLSLLNIGFESKLAARLFGARCDKPAMICEFCVSDVRKCWLRSECAALDKLEGYGCHDPV